VRFGWLTLAHSPSPEDDTAAVHEQVSQACFAETAGFDGVWLTEHNFTGESVYCDPIPLASAVAARTSRVRIGFAVIQLALRHPIRLAVQLALLDNLSDGRLDVGVGSGSIYNEYEYLGYGLRSHDSRERMTETLDLLVRAWTEAPLVHQGKFYLYISEGGVDGRSPRISLMDKHGNVVARWDSLSAHGIWVDAHGDIYLALGARKRVDKYVRTA
jgi:alkanesulfonate monooxygenase SsuD/methylene tetrahydromethanopterin reductase-like flavin-dependent oxidoreductase (luciferase family)